MNTKLRFLLNVFTLTVSTVLIILLNPPIQASMTAVLNTPATLQGDTSLFLPLVRSDLPLPTIHYFQADVTIADPGDTIQLEWSVSDAISTTIYHLMPTGQFGEFWNVASTGTMTYTISDTTRNHTDFMLFAANATGQWVGASLNIPLTCPDVWFFSPAPDICPAAPALYSVGSEQHFEHGVMIWVQVQDMIYVLYEDDQYTTKWEVYVDEWDEGEPIDDPSIIPPPGYYQPLRGFGLVWRDQPLVRERLGWAVDEEGNYDTAVQRTSYAEYNHTYIGAQDGNVWDLWPERSGWEKIIVIE